MAIVSLILVIYMTFSCTYVSAECPNGWTRFDDSCYRIYQARLIWPEAQFACEMENGFLAVIETKQASTNIHALIKEFHVGVSSRDSIWIGLSDVRHEGVWVWEDSKQNATFFDWGPGEPNQALMKQEEDCVVIGANPDHQWADVRCEKTNHYMCERNHLTPVVR